MSLRFEQVAAALADRYPIEREIGRGGMATVYLARDLRHERPVAIKVMNPGISATLGGERFLDEIRVTAGLQHPYILPLHDSGETRGVLFFVMPFVEGGTLRDRLRRERQLPVDEAVKIAVAIAGALAHAHDRNVIHRDIKPENILIHHAQPMLVDFGIARARSQQLSITEPGAVLGTPPYMSPEQLAGRDEIGPASDVYALGCLLYEMLAGEAPFPGSTLESVIAQRFADPRPSVRRIRDGVPVTLDLAIQKALSQAPEDRFSPADFATAIQDKAPPSPRDQRIGFCTAPDGARIAYAVVGDGPPLVKAANWLNHLEHDWESPIWRHWLAELSRRNTLLRYDERGCGLSDREVEDISFEAFVRDLETVVDAVGLERFALLGVSQGGAIAVAYAVRHPERVSHLVLHGAYARGWKARGVPADYVRLQQEMVRHGWGLDNPAFRQTFSLLFFPDASPEQLSSFAELQRVSSSPEGAARIIGAINEIDVRDLAPHVKAPTLVLHCRDETRVPFEEGRLLASLIPNARLVPLASRNHVPLEWEPAWPKFLAEVHGFLSSDATSASPHGSPRHPA